MEAHATSQELNEALETLRQYLADNIAPLGAAGHISYLLEQHSGLLAEELSAWATAQLSSKDISASLSDYLFHAVKKVYELSELLLVSADLMDRRLDQLGGMLIELCPEHDRETLKQRLPLVGRSETALSAAVGYIRRPLEIDGSKVADVTGEGIEQRIREIEEQNLELGRMLRALQQDQGRGKALRDDACEARAKIAADILTTALNSLTTAAEFERLRKQLSPLGIDTRPAMMIRALGSALPGWAAPAEGETDAEVPSSRWSELVTAMLRVISLAEQARERADRYGELIRAAVEQLNRGLAGRAVSALAAAEKAVQEGHVDADTAQSLRRECHAPVDLEQLKILADNPDQHSLLKRVMDFFEAFGPEQLLDSLQDEPKREQRRLLLGLLEVHGAEARQAALVRLEKVLRGEELATQWYFPRNLLYLLNRIPRAESTPAEREIELVASILNPLYPVPLVREAVTVLGRITDQEAERILMNFCGRLQETLLRAKGSRQDSLRLLSLLDRSVMTMAHRGTPETLAAVLEHGFSKQEALGDTFSRLAYLAGQDLSSAPEATARLIAALKAAMPRKVLGLTMHKDAHQLLPLVKALSCTRTPEVRAALQEVAERVADQECGSVAAAAIRDWDAAR